MDIKSSLFDKIRISKNSNKAKPKKQQTSNCAHNGCNNPGIHRAPMGIRHEGKYLRFCLKHVKEYNRSYNYFNDINKAKTSQYTLDNIIYNRAKQQTKKAPIYTNTTIKALQVMDLDERATEKIVNEKYKQLVKKFHPDSNNGDRSYENRLIEIIKAYKYLRSVRLNP